MTVSAAVGETREFVSDGAGSPENWLSCETGGVICASGADLGCTTLDSASAVGGRKEAVSDRAASAENWLSCESGEVIGAGV